jgi:hypothetical protein
MITLKTDTIIYEDRNFLIAASFDSFDEMVSFQDKKVIVINT